jgi:hypothetical protein
MLTVTTKIERTEYDGRPTLEKAEGYVKYKNLEKPLKGKHSLNSF